MKEDIEGNYVARFIVSKPTPPRSFGVRNLLQMYFVSPNSRYFCFVGIVFTIVTLWGVYDQSLGGPFTDSSYIGITVGGLFSVFCFTFPFAPLLRIRHAIRTGVMEVGEVVKVRNARNTPYSTAEGMRHGAIYATVRWNASNQEQISEVFLDRPWVRLVEPGLEVQLLVDPNKLSILYVLAQETVSKPHLR